LSFLYTGRADGTGVPDPILCAIGSRRKRSTPSKVFAWRQNTTFLSQRDSLGFYFNRQILPFPGLVRFAPVFSFQAIISNTILAVLFISLLPGPCIVAPQLFICKGQTSRKRGAQSHGLPGVSPRMAGLPDNINCSACPLSAKQDSEATAF
jgi:hypothetical protein